MTDLTRGADNTLTALFYSAPSSPVDVSNLVLNVVSLADSSVVLGPISTGFGHPATGAYTYLWSVPGSLTLGDYLVLWTGDVSGTPISANETVSVVGTAAYSPGPCDVWPVIWPRRCDLTGVSPEVTGAAVEAASQFLYYATAQRFGLCQVALRPCREECYGTGWPGWASWWQYGTYPQPYWYNGTWFNMGCGQCTSGCSCTAISETYLPGPIASVVSVKVDGVTLVNGTDYRVDDYRKLVRLGALWPYCNDLNQPSTAVGTWEVVVNYGEPVPTLGQLAVGQLACYFVDFLNGEDCELPAGITDLSRQGISMSFQNVDNGLTQFYAQFPIANLFIKTYNPQGLLARAKAYDLDGPDYRAVGTA